MTPEAQRIAIAEACGWKKCQMGIGWGWIPPTKPWRYESVTPLPDYLSDLNAIREAEATLDDEQLADMAEHLGADANDNAPADDWRILLRATAAQRAEAFLRTVGKWDECAPKPAATEYLRSLNDAFGSTERVRLIKHHKGGNCVVENTATGEQSECAFHDLRAAPAATGGEGGISP